MGDRAVVVFSERRDKTEYFSPSIYLHWSGDEVFDLLVKAIPRMRAGGLDYSAACFCGVCHEEIEGNLSLGLYNAPKDRKEVESEEFSHGDAGVFVVDVKTWKVEAFNGYGFADPSGGANGQQVKQLPNTPPG